MAILPAHSSVPALALAIGLAALARVVPSSAAADHPLAAAFRADPLQSPLPDFSYAGYRAGAAEPGVPATARTFDVTRFGARPDDGKDDIDAIQSAIDAAAAAGGGVIVFPSGTFDFDVGTTRRNLRIRTSNLVLRGAGSGANGTVFYDHAYSDSPNPREKWRANGYPSFIAAGAYEAPDAVGYLPPHDRVLSTVGETRRGSLRIPLGQPAAIRTGATYLLAQTDPDGSLVAHLTEPMPPARIAPGYRAPGRIRFAQLVRVLRLEEGEAVLDAPVLWELRAAWKPELREIPVIRNVGVEGIRFRTPWTGPFVHHRNAEHDDGWNHVRFDGVEDGWVRDTVHDGTTAAVMLASTKHCTIRDAVITGPRGHNGFTVIGASTYNLLTRLDAGDSFHSYQLQGMPVGNVFHRCTARGGGGIDLHGGIGVHNLYDRPEGFGVQHGGSNQAVPPRHGRGLVLWNWQPRVIVDEPNMPGTLVAGGNGETVRPESLFEFQQRLRAAVPGSPTPAR